MRSTRARLLLACVASALLSACGDNQDEMGARDLLAAIRAQGYRGWERAPGLPARATSRGPHGGEVDIYVNDVVSAALAAGDPLGTWPLGSLIAKDGWDGSDLEHIAVMQKRSDGWFWAEYDGDGDAAYSGHPDVCTDCHRRGSDDVLSFRLP